ncbi:MAG: hypothetical protein K8F91_25175 [Candidatus Obscuribacterales bacterium]|nr:hypothetical protein [Candidatus Obscuribacterales bacterium]
MNSIKIRALSQKRRAQSGKAQVHDNLRFEDELIKIRKRTEHLVLRNADGQLSLSRQAYSNFDRFLPILTPPHLRKHLIIFMPRYNPLLRAHLKKQLQEQKKALYTLTKARFEKLVYQTSIVGDDFTAYDHCNANHISSRQF